MRTTFIALCFFLITGSVHAGTTYTVAGCKNESGNYDVQAEVNKASDGDTVIIGAGTCTWDATVTVTKNIILKGAGSSSTIISGGDLSLITYAPTTPSATNTFEVYDMSLTRTSGATSVISLAHTSGAVMQQIKIHDLTMSSSGSAFWFSGVYSGVIYKNTITTVGQLQQNAGGGDGASGLTEWDTIQKCSGSPLSCLHDDGRNLYWEDNTLNVGDTILESGGAGFSWVARYNTINFNIVSPAFDWHGNYPSPNGRCSSMDMAVYGNSLIRASGSGQPYLVPRGGIGLVFYNYADVDGDNVLRVNFQDEYDDSSGACTDTTNQQPQHVFDTYVWVNKRTSSVCAFCTEEDDTGDIAENSEYFCQHAGIFDGTGNAESGGGVGAGTIASRPATCTTGVGYWATTQSCSDLTGMVGVNPSNPISGTLYKCTATNTWTAYYTPYTYPHPLRGLQSPSNSTAKHNGTRSIGTRMVQ